MLSRELAQQILHNINLQINSNTNVIKPNTLNPWNKIMLWRDTKKALSELNVSYPHEKIKNRDNLLNQFAILYSEARRSNSDDDEPMMHRFLTNGLYQEWKSDHNSFIFYPLVHDIQIKQAQITSNDHGKWIQCLLGMKFADQGKGGSIYEETIVERKLGMGSCYVRGWYYIEMNKK